MSQDYIGPAFQAHTGPDDREIEWGVQVGANRAWAWRGADEDEARERLAYYRQIWGDLARVVCRRVDPWEEVSSEAVQG